MIDILIKRELTRTIGLFNDDILAEINASMSELYGSPNDWEQVGVFDTLTRAVGRAANRVFVGKDLCMWTQLMVSETSGLTEIYRQKYGLRHGRCPFC